MSEANLSLVGRELHKESTEPEKACCWATVICGLCEHSVLCFTLIIVIQMS